MSESSNKSASALLRLSSALVAANAVEGENSHSSSEDVAAKRPLSRGRRLESDSSSGDQPSFMRLAVKKKSPKPKRCDSFGPGVVGLDVLRNSNRAITRIDSDEEEVTRLSCSGVRGSHAVCAGVVAGGAARGGGNVEAAAAFQGGGTAVGCPVGRGGAAPVDAEAQ